MATENETKKQAVLTDIDHAITNQITEEKRSRTVHTDMSPAETLAKLIRQVMFCYVSAASTAPTWPKSAKTVSEDAEKAEKRTREAEDAEIVRAQDAQTRSAEAFVASDAARTRMIAEAEAIAREIVAKVKKEVENTERFYIVDEHDIAMWHRYVTYLDELVHVVVNDLKNGRAIEIKKCIFAGSKKKMRELGLSRRRELRALERMFSAKLKQIAMNNVIITIILIFQMNIIVQKKKNVLMDIN